MHERSRLSARPQPGGQGDGAGPVLDDAVIPRLVRFVLQPDGATMGCHYCEHSAPINPGDVAGQILRFQEAHFGCDPALGSTAAAAGCTSPPQWVLD